MRLLAALLLAPLLLAAAAARDWTTVATRTPTGAYVIGNPAAPVKLVEYASYTCPHCAAFAAESAPVLKERMIRSGRVSLELRHLIRDSADLAAALVARCTGPRGFAATSAAIFAQQAAWLPRAMAFQDGNAARLAMYPPLAKLRATADGAGLSDIGRAAGLTDARLDACFTDQAEVDRILAMTAGARDVNATPTFFLDGAKLPQGDWAHVEPVLRAHGAR